jgi:hypothetical protein
MAHVRLKAGTEFDILSSEEHLAHVQRLRDEISRFFLERDGTIDTHAAPSFLTDAGGNTVSLPGGGGKVYTVRAGFHGYLVRLSIDYEGSNPSAPQNAGVKVCADQVSPGSLRAVTNVIPNVFSESRTHAPVFRPGQSVVVGLQGGPASTAIYCVTQMLLVPTSALLGTDVLKA